MKIQKIVGLIAPLLLALPGAAQTLTCQISTAPGKVVLDTHNDGTSSLQIGDSESSPVFRVVELELRADFVKSCHFGSAQFESCVQASLGPLDEYQQGLPLMLGSILSQEADSKLKVSFDTSKIEKARMYYLMEMNPMIGNAGLLRFFDKQGEALGQFLEIGTAQECL